MTTRSLPVIVAGIVGIGFGLVGGYLLSAPQPCPFPFGRKFGVGTQTFVDGPFVEFLISKARPEVQGEWTLHLINDVGFYLKKFSDAPIFPRQSGSLYVLRAQPDPWNVDAEALDFLRELITLGIVEHGGYWGTWDALRRRMQEVIP